MCLKRPRGFFKKFTFLLVVLCYLNPLGGANKLVDDADLYEYFDGSGDSFSGSGDRVAPPSPSEDLKVPPPGGRGPKAFGSGPTIPSVLDSKENASFKAKEGEDSIVDSDEEPEFSPEEYEDSDFSFAPPVDQDKFDEELFSGLTSTTTTSEAPTVKPQNPTTKVSEKVTPVDAVTLPFEPEYSEFDYVKGACIIGIAVLILITLTCVICRCVKKRRVQRRIRDKKTVSMIKNGNTEKSDSFRFTSPARRSNSTTQTEPVPVVVTRLPDVAATAAAANSKFLHVDDLMPRTFTSFTPSAPVYGETTIPVSEVDKLLDDTQRQLEELERLGESNDRPRFDFMTLRETSLDEPDGDGASRNSVEFAEKEEQEITKELDSFLDSLGPRYR